MPKMEKTILSEEEFKILINNIRQEVHEGIGPLREKTFTLLPALKTADTIDEIPELMRYYEYKPVPEKGDSEEKLAEFAQDGCTCARKFQEATQKLAGETAREVLRITTRAGVLLYFTEQILMRYEGLVKQKNKTLPTNFGTIILSEALTAVATARDHMIAADGYIKNLQGAIGSRERWRLMGLWFLPTIVVYLLFHPSIPFIPLVPSDYQIFWEVVFWSLFGAIAISFITISEEVNKDIFDPRHLFKYEYRIPVAPFIAVVLVLFISLLGIEAGGITIKLDLANPNFPVVVLLSFFFGFFGKRSLDLLDDAWQKLFPSTRAEEKQETPKTTQGSSSESETTGTPKQ